MLVYLSSAYSSQLNFYLNYKNSKALNKQSQKIINLINPSIYQCPSTILDKACKNSTLVYAARNEFIGDIVFLHYLSFIRSTIKLPDKICTGIFNFLNSLALAYFNGSSVTKRKELKNSSRNPSWNVKRNWSRCYKTFLRRNLLHGVISQCV